MLSHMEWQHQVWFLFFYKILFLFICFSFTFIIAILQISFFNYKLRKIVSSFLLFLVKIAIWESQLSERAEILAITTKALSEGYIPWKRKEVLKLIGYFSDLR